MELWLEILFPSDKKINLLIWRRMMKKHHIVIIVVAIGFLSFCSKEPAQPEYPVIVDTVDGIKSYMNPEYPRDGRFDLLSCYNKKR